MKLTMMDIQRLLSSLAGPEIRSTRPTRRKKCSDDNSSGAVPRAVAGVTAERSIALIKEEEGTYGCKG